MSEKDIITMASVNDSNNEFGKGVDGRMRYIISNPEAI